MERQESWWWVSAALGITALVLAFLPSTANVPMPGAAVIPAGALSTAPPRTMMTDPPTVKLGGFSRDCMNCHTIFKYELPTGRQLRQHTHIKMNHGINRRCLGCHDQNDRNRLNIGVDGTVPFQESHRMCGKCHGPVFRDWERGTHGRSTGSWDTASKERGKLTCVECHDPHSPAYKTYKPLPPPNTLRMGDPKKGTAHHPTRNPLMRKRGSSTDAAHPPKAEH